MWWILTFLPLVEVANASFAKNLNYRSPSENHPQLGVAINKIVKRNLAERATIDASQLNFTHGVASGGNHYGRLI